MADKKGTSHTEPQAAKDAAKRARAESQKTKRGDKPKEVVKAPTVAATARAKKGPHKARAHPTLDAATQTAMGQRRDKDARRPRFRRHEWWRYVKLGGKNASWKLPRGMHSKARRHFKYRPPVVSIGYRGPAAARGLHPSGFQEVLVWNPEDVAKLDKATQAARVGGTVGGMKAKLIQKKADELGVRILNRRLE
jgi:large subunit ribosomal protein L32e